MAEENFGKAFENFGTDAIHSGQDPDQWNARMVVPPITMSTTFKQKGPGETYVSSCTNTISRVTM